MTDNYCARHNQWRVDGACRLCQDELIAEHPDAAPLIRRQRRWSKIATIYGAVMTLVIVGGYYAFLAVREWRIWTH